MLERVGPWVVTGSLGGGWSARVYSARHEDGREAAVKVFRRDRGRRVEDGVRFLREGRLLRDLDHPCIPELFEMGLDDEQRMFLALERIPGRDLRAVLQGLAARDVGLRRSVRKALLLPTFLRACDAVQHAHDRGIVHADLSPSNLLADGQGRVGLVDWGLARRFRPPDPPTPRRAPEGKRPVLRVDGTPGYVAPERLARPLDQPLPAVDLYSLGAVLYHLLAFRPAFEARTIPGRLAAAFQPPVDPRVRCPEMEIPGALAELALRAMAVDPAARPETAAQLAQAVRSALETS